MKDKIYEKVIVTIEDFNLGKGGIRPGTYVIDTAAYRDNPTYRVMVYNQLLHLLSEVLKPYKEVKRGKPGKSNNRGSGLPG